MRAVTPWIVALLLAPAAHSLETFQAGQVATAAAFNNNFSELDEKISRVQQRQGGWRRDVDGTEMTVSSNRYGFYSLQSDQGYTLTIDEDGDGYNSWFYFAEKNCTGQSYVSTGFDQHKTVSHLYLAKRLAPEQLIADNNQLYMTDETGLVKLYAQSRRINGDCSNIASTEIAFRLVANDAAKTGFPDTLPYEISGTEQRLRLTTTVGQAPDGDNGTGSYSVYANGTRIGSISYLPSSASTALYNVKLDGYEGYSVTLYKDGSYSGLGLFESETLYYLTDDCSGNPYVEVLDDFSREWWFKERLEKPLIENNDHYYQQSEQLYKMSSGPGSKRSDYSSSCSKVTTGNNQDGYRRLTPAAAPDMPVFGVPISWEGQQADTQYSELPEAY